MWNLNEKIFWPCAKLSHGFLRGSYWNDWISPMRICRTTVNVTEVAKIAHKWIYRANWLFIHIVQWDSSPWCCCQSIKDLHFRQNEVSITISISSNYNKSELKVRPSFCITSTFVILLFQTGILFFFFWHTNCCREKIIWKVLQKDKKAPYISSMWLLKPYWSFVWRKKKITDTFLHWLELTNQIWHQLKVINNKHCYLSSGSKLNIITSYVPYLDLICLSHKAIEWL